MSIMLFYFFLFFLISFFLSYLHRMGFLTFIIFSLLFISHQAPAHHLLSRYPRPAPPEEARSRAQAAVAARLAVASPSMPVLRPTSSSQSWPRFASPSLLCPRFPRRRGPRLRSASPPDAINTEGHFGTGPTWTKAGAGEASFLGSIFSEWLQSARFAGIQA